MRFSFRGIYDYLYYFRLHVRAAVKFLDENKVDFMFMSTPSMGFDNVLYEVSKFKKVKYICLFQVHNNRFWTQSWDDMGIFNFSNQYFQYSKLKHKKKYLIHIKVRFQKNNLNKESYIKKYI